MNKNKIFEKRKVKTLGCLIILFGVSIFLLNYGLSQNNLKSADKIYSSEDIFTELKISVAASPIFIDDTIPGSDWAWAVTQTWCTGSGTVGDPYLLENLEIDGLGGVCITIQNSNVYFIIRFCTLFNAIGPGIYLYNVANGTINTNDLTNNDHGIYMEFSSYNNIVGNTIYGNTWGTDIALVYSDYNTFEDNFLENGYQGFHFDGSNNNAILRNTATKNVNYGFVLVYDSDLNYISENILKYQNGADGIIIAFGCDSNTITENIIEDNPRNGISLWDSYFNEFSGNIVRNNTLIGIDVDNLASDNLFYENYFIGNGVHATDAGINNDWNSALIGNYWDDYAGVDANDDGIGDTPYIIPGTAGSQDNIPIWEDGDDIAPVITIISPLLDSIFGLDAPNYSITIDELNLDTFWYTLEAGGTIYTITSLTGTFDQTAWAALPFGEVTITFYAEDAAGNLGSAEVTVEKKEPTVPWEIGLDFFTTSILILMFSGVAVIVIIAKIHSKKRIIS